MVSTYRPAARENPVRQRAAVAGLALPHDRAQPVSDRLPGFLLDVPDHHQDFRLDSEAVQEGPKLGQQDSEISALVVGRDDHAQVEARRHTAKPMRSDEVGKGRPGRRSVRSSGRGEAIHLVAEVAVRLARLEGERGAERCPGDGRRPLPPLRHRRHHDQSRPLPGPPLEERQDVGALEGQVLEPDRGTLRNATPRATRVVRCARLLTTTVRPSGCRASSSLTNCTVSPTP